MTTVLVLVIVLALTAWLAGLVVQLEREIAATRRRTRLAWDKEQKLRTMIDHMLTEETTLNQGIIDQTNLIAQFQRQVAAAQANLAESLAAGRPRLFVLNPRRAPTDKEWIVTLSCPPSRAEVGMPSAREWAEGRNYLVFAKSDQDARERALRRFGSRPALTIKASVPAPADLFTTFTPVSAAPP